MELDRYYSKSWRNGYDRGRDEALQAVINIIKAMPNHNPSYWCVCDVVDRQKIINIIEERLRKRLESDDE